MKHYSPAILLIIVLVMIASMMIMPAAARSSDPMAPSATPVPKKRVVRSGPGTARPRPKPIIMDDSDGKESVTVVAPASNTASLNTVRRPGKGNYALPEKDDEVLVRRTPGKPKTAKKVRH